MSTTRWFYVDRGERQGPVRLDELVELIVGAQLSIGISDRAVAVVPA